LNLKILPCVRRGILGMSGGGHRWTPRASGSSAMVLVIGLQAAVELHDQAPLAGDAKLGSFDFVTASTI